MVKMKKIDPDKELKNNFNKVVKYLKDKGKYEKTDELLINELVFTISMANDAKQDIKDRGYNINVRAHTPEKPPYIQPNPSIGIYNQCVKSIMSLSAKLGLSVQDREKLKIYTVEKDDLDDLLQK